jgi:tripartite-type tricarboxylate transporter receptor subunit TctC
MVRCFAALGVIISLVTALCSDPALAQGDFPTRPVKLVVPYPGGGSNDVLARIVAE